MYHTFFQWETSKEARAQVIIAGLKNPTPDICRATAEAEAASKGKHPHSFHTFLEMIRAFYFISSPIIPFALNVPHLYTDADKQPADNLTKVAALDIDNLLTKTPDISKGVIFQCLISPIKGMRSRFFGCPSRGYYAGTVNRGNF